MLSNYPKVLKYTIDDRVYTISSYTDGSGGWGYPEGYLNERYNGVCKRVKITGWRTEVSDANGNGTGTAIQKDFYMVKDILGYSTENALNTEELYATNEYELPSHKLFSSKNHLLFFTKGKHINSPFGNLADNGYLYFSKMGNSGGYGLTNGDWSDWAGMNFKDMDFSEVIYNSSWAGSLGDPAGFVGGEVGGTKTFILDGCNLEGAILKSAMNTRSRLISGVFSYDAETTIYTDGYPVGLPVSGTVAGTSGGAVLTGTGTKFLTEVEIGDSFTIYNVAGTFTILSISSDTSLTVEETFPGTFSTRSYSRHYGV